ncbi:hypothetical protein CDAR_76871 [Caerostris darwini]|uniref:Uncharacterized protein n=1 Tax=Caerostris darwini TaxID=1538125 RepID=A0AAV4QF09_9ARAC|nr:hypothetical protein CDAR_76871 [Caerostris darwini]
MEYIKGPARNKRGRKQIPENLQREDFRLCVSVGLKSGSPQGGRGVRGWMRFGNGAIKPGSGWTETKESGFPGLICKRTVFRRCLAEWVVQPLIFQGVS